MTAWHLYPPALHDDTVLRAVIITVLESVHRPRFIGQLASNLALPVMIHSLRRVGFWRICMVLTPWMLAYLLLPDQDPGLAVPDHLTTEGANAADMLGPVISFTLLGTQHKAHLNFDPQLGHYLLQPLILGMDRYTDAKAVFIAWDHFVVTRMAAAKRSKRSSREQQETISRRELLAYLIRYQ
ncbi:hypothetical protein RIEGSTA812A_PEG_1257 [invertebrate metagenome]|uniref:Uncharacterized protein n=1 Tax=invertebrate metagenome TaxID=1711999 RepID=A0A484H7Q2_9ZZZZ